MLKKIFTEYGFDIEVSHLDSVTFLTDCGIVYVRVDKQDGSTIIARRWFIDTKHTDIFDIRSMSPQERLRVLQRLRSKGVTYSRMADLTGLSHSTIVKTSWSARPVSVKTPIAHIG